MNKITAILVKLVDKDVFTTRLITAAMTAAVIYVEVTGGTLSETMRNAWLLIMGFWFNSEITKNGRRRK